MAERVIMPRKSAFKKLAQSVRGSCDRLSASRNFLWVSVVTLAAIIAFVTTFSLQTIPTKIQVGTIASRDIKADRNYEIIDKEASDKFKEEAKASVLPVLDFDMGMAKAIVGRVNDGFAAAGKAYENWVELQNSKGRRKGGVKLSDEALNQIGGILSEQLGVEIGEEYGKAIIDEGLGGEIQGDIESLVESAMSVPLLSEGAESELAGGDGAVVRVVEEEGVENAGHKESIVDVDLMITAPTAREELKLTPEMEAGLRSGELRAAILGIARLLIRPNCTVNRQETNRQLEEAAATAQRVIIKVSAGEMIVREGSRYEPRHVKIITAIAKEKRRGSYYLEFFGTFILSLLFLIIPFLLLQRYFTRITIHKSDYVLMALVGLAMLVVIRISLLLAPAVSEALFYASDPSMLHYAMPIAGAAMVIRMFLGAEITLVFALFMSVTAGFFVETNVSFMAFSLVTSITAIMAITNVDRRSMIIRAGVITGGIGAAAVVGIALIESVISTSAFSMGQALWGILFSFLGGIGAAVFAMIGAPIIESLSDYTSDIKLLELANLNHPLLRELIVRAPGTYHHSHVVGLLGEAAAQSIGANALLVRVGAYYHDIGKIRKPLYFIENAKAGENRHEKLTPQMSSLIVSAHVKDGLELAQNAKIPQCISDMIPQHHGTRRIGFFYDKAMIKTDPEVMKVDPKQFQYPGPKPQTSEAAILMLSDVTEASVRALKEKSPMRIEQTVKKTIDDIFSESQLDECDLTLRDLTNIGKAFVRILLGIYHLRIEYEKEIEKEEDNERERTAEKRRDEAGKDSAGERSSDDEPTVKEGD